MVRVAPARGQVTSWEGPTAIPGDERTALFGGGHSVFSTLIQRNRVTAMCTTSANVSPRRCSEVRGSVMRPSACAGSGRC